jgi:hypothetical protein
MNNKKLLKYEYPKWYITPQEFANLVVLSLEENSCFKSNKKAHPQDIEAMFSVTAKAIADGIAYAGFKLSESKTNKKNALLTPKNLLK